MFDLLREVIQGQHFLGQFWTERTVTETSNSVLGSGEHGEIDTLILSDSSLMLFNLWQCAGTGMEVEVLCWNQKRTRVSVSQACLHHSTEKYLCLTLPGVNSRPKKSSSLNDLPKWVK